VHPVSRHEFLNYRNIYMQLTLKTGQAKLWVLLIGVSQYHDRRFPILQYSTIDTQRLADAFADVIQEFPYTSVQAYHDNATAPTLSEVQSSLQTIVEQAKPEDTVVFYFCGHGALDSRMQQVVFCLADTQKDAMLQTGLSAIKLLGLLGNCAAKQQVLWIDVCHANGMTPQTDTPELLDNPVGQLIQMFRQQATQNPEFQALLSCDAPTGRGRDRSQQSWKFPELGHGIFSHFLIEGLRGAAANPQGIVIASVLANYVHDRTVQYIDHTNQQLEWLNRETENRPSIICQTPARIAQAQTQTVLGIKPIDPLELLFPDIKATNIDPPLDRSASLRKPQPDTVTIIPPPIEKPSSIEPTIPPIQKIASEPIEPIISSSVQHAEQTAILPIQESNSVSVKPEIESFNSFDQEAVPEPSISPFQEITSEPIQSESEPIIPSVQDPIPEAVEPLIQHNIFERVEPDPKPIVEKPNFPIIQPPITQPVRWKRNTTQRQIKRFQRETQKQLQQTSTSLQAAIAQARRTATTFAITQRAQSKQRAAQLQNALTTKLSVLNQSIHQAANSGQALYRQRTSDATNTVQYLDRSTRNLSESVLGQAQKPDTQQRVTTGLKIFSVVALGVAGVGLYQARTEKIYAVQKLSSAATTQLEANQTVEALSTALKAGHKLQQVDLPWNFVPESLRISTIATLQQAVAASEEPTPAVGVSLSNASLSPDQKTFAASTSNNSIQLWQRNGDKLQQLHTDLRGHKAAITQLVFSPDGKRLASASEDKTIKLWNVEQGILIQTLSAHTQAVTALSFRSDGEVLASGSADQTIKLWNVAKGRILDTFQGHNATASVIRFSPDGRILAAGTLTNTIHLWYPDSQNPILLGDHGSSEAQGVNDLAFSPDGKTIASAGSDSTIKLWTVGDAKAERETVPTQTLSGHDKAVTSLSFSANGQILASGGRDRTIRLWNMQNGTFLKTLVGSQDPIEQIAFSTDGKALLSVGNRYGLKVWNFDLNTLMQAGCRIAGNRAQAECS